MSDQDDRRHALYIRVSTVHQAEEGESLDEQETKLRAYCTFKDWTGLEVYREEGKSAKDTNRPELQRLIADIEAGMGGRMGPSVILHRGGLGSTLTEYVQDVPDGVLDPPKKGCPLL